MHTKNIETKIVRVKHTITFNKGTSIRTLIEELSFIPDKAIVEDSYEGSAPNEPLCTIKFIEETELR